MPTNPPHTPHRAPWLETLCSACAISGGLILVLEIILVVVSVTGRTLIPLGTKPIPGDYELVSMASAIAIFCFLPWCQLNRKHIRVTLATPLLPPALRKSIDVFADAAMTIMAVLILRQLFLGALDKLTYGHLSFILEIPIGLGYLLCIPPATLLVVAAAWTCMQHMQHNTTPP